jgi:hypothetical protein
MLIVSLSRTTPAEDTQHVADQMKARTGLDTIVIDGCSGVLVVEVNDTPPRHG